MTEGIEEYQDGTISVSSIAESNVVEIKDYKEYSNCLCKTVCCANEKDQIKWLKFDLTEYENIGSAGNTSFVSRMNYQMIEKAK